MFCFQYVAATNDDSQENCDGKLRYGDVYKCLYKGQRTALKLFRNTTKENAIKEIEIMFALRHPHIIGLYAWILKSGQIDQ